MEEVEALEQVVAAVGEEESHLVTLTRAWTAERAGKMAEATTVLVLSSTADQTAKVCITTI